MTLKSEDGDRSAPVYTTRWGRYFFDSVEPGDYILEIWPRGYKHGLPVSREVTVPDRERVELQTIIVDREFSP